jgi:hypothetical protein
MLILILLAGILFVLLLIAFPGLKHAIATFIGAVIVLLGVALVASGNLDLNNNVEMIVVLLAVGVGVGVIHKFVRGLRGAEQPPPTTGTPPGANQQMMFDSGTRPPSSVYAMLKPNGIGSR